LLEKRVYDCVVIGGGLAGISAAISSARLGCKVALVQDRPVLGGNSSSEVGVGISGADGGGNRNARETGIIEELRIEDRYRNHLKLKLRNGMVNSIWDIILWEWVKKEKNIDLYLNTRAIKANMESSIRIGSVFAEQTLSERRFQLEADIFIDASGDGAVACSAGAKFRIGRESRNEFGESRAPQIADKWTMGSSLLFRAKDMGHPVSFNPPFWAYDFPKDEDLPFRKHTPIQSGFWWIEYGGTLDTIKDNEKIRDELLRILFGVWDHIKNHGDHGAENFALDWVSSIPGKRESRRFIGDYILTQNDLEKHRLFPDRVAYGGWPIDLHPPQGIFAKEPPCENSYPGLYSIPFRSLYSKNIENLMMAGRNISVTHVALGSTRVMATCAVEGQAVGTAAYLCKKYNTLPRGVYKNYINELQQLLLKNDCYIIGLKNEDENDLARKAKVTASSFKSEEYKPENVISGVSRPEGNNTNIWISNPNQEMPQYIDLEFDNKKEINTISLTFDTNLDKLVEIGPVPECVRDYTLYFYNGKSWVKILSETGNYHRHRQHTFGPIVTKKLRIEVNATNGANEARIYEIRAEKI